jgi:hypothetical protein
VFTVTRLTSAPERIMGCIFDKLESNVQLADEFMCFSQSIGKRKHFNLGLMMTIFFIFSSPELKAQVSFSDRLASVCLSVCKVIHFRLLLQNAWANFNHTWHKSSLGGGDSSLFKQKG